MNNLSSKNSNSTSSTNLISNEKKKGRLVKGKPLSMNENLLNQIVKETYHEVNNENNTKVKCKRIQNRNPIPNSSIVKNNSISLNSEQTLQNSTIENLSYNNSYSKKMSLKKANNSIKKLRGSKSKIALNKNSSVASKVQNISLTTVGSLNNSFYPNISNSFDISLPSNRNLRKTPSNGLDTISSLTQQSRYLKTEISQGSMGTMTERENYYLNNFLKNSQTPVVTYKSDTFKLNEELLEYKLNNAKLRNEINILHEKIKTLKQVINIKNSESELIKSKYNDMTEDFKKEIEKMKKANGDYNQLKENFVKQNIYVKSTLAILIDLMEYLISNKTGNNFGNRQYINIPENTSASYSIDIYDSYNNDEERRGTIIDQIQGLLLTKLSVIKKNLGLDLEKEIERIKNWSLKSNNSEVNISNFKISKFYENNESSESFKKLNSGELFDLSTSNHFVGQSPKFNADISVNNEKINENKYNEYELRSNFSLKKIDDDNLILNDSFLKDLKQNDSFCYDRNGSLVQSKFTSNMDTNKKENYEVNMNYLDCSMTDLNAEIKPLNNNKEARMLFNDDPTEFNMELDILRNPKEDDNMSNISIGQVEKEKSAENSEDNSVPIILNPIIINNNNYK